MIRKLIRDQALRRGEAPAILSPGRAGLSYGGLDAMVMRVGGWLAALEVGPRDRVALVCSNGPEMATAFLGIAGHAVCAPLNPSYRASEFEFYLGDLRPRAVLLEAGLDSAVRAVASGLGIPVYELAPRLARPAGECDLPGSPAEEPGLAQFPGPDDVALLLHTSGTTSRPKLVPLTQGNLCASARNISESLRLTEADRCLNVMPLFHIHGLAAAILASINAGASVVCCPDFVAPRFFEWVEEFRPSWYTAVPAIHQSVLARAPAHREVIEGNPFRFIRSCSSALAPSLMEEMEATFGVPVVETYGMTEAAHQMASSPLPPGQRKKGSVGVAAGPEVGIMDQGGHLLPPGVSGEVVIRGPNVTSGYLDNPEANVDSYTDSWFRTGDQGYLDDGGFLFLTGRLKEIINRGGEKIAPREIDEALLSHPAVDQAAAFAVSHPYLGETVAAAVVLRWGSAATERELREFAASRIASFKVPEKVLFVEEIPKGPTGKIQRIGLAAKLGVDQIAEARAERPAYAAPGTRVEKEIASIFAATLGVRRVGLADNFFDLGGDSLLVAMLLTEIQQSTGVAIPLLTFVEEPSVAGVCRNLRAPRLQQASGSSDAQLRVIIRGGQSRPPLVCVPGSYGNVVGFFRLAQHLGADQPVTAFRLPAVARNGVYSIEHLAARYVAELLEVHPEGPYHLLGSCTGGFVACEMARQILAQGKTVGLLALMDCYNHAWGGGLPRIEKLGYRAGLLEKRFIYHHRNLRSAGLSRAARYLRPRWAAFRQTTRERCEEWAHDLILRWGFQLPAALEDPRLAIRHAAAHYVPPDYPGRLELFQVAEPRVDAYDYPDMGWQGKARGGIGMHQIPGSHATMLSEPNVRVIAAELLGCLDREWCVR